MMCCEIYFELIFKSIWLIYILQLSYHASQKIRKLQNIISTLLANIGFKIIIRYQNYQIKRCYQPILVPALRMQLAFFTETLCILCHWANIQKVHTLITDFNTTTGLDLIMSLVGSGEKIISILEWVIPQKSFKVSGYRQRPSVPDIQ